MSNSKITKTRSRIRRGSIPLSSSPHSAQNTLNSSPITSPSKPINIPQKKQLKQSLLAFGLNERKICNDCGMTYLKNLKSDIKQHQKFHERCLNGRDWNENWGDTIITFNNKERIVKVNPLKQLEVNATLDLLEIVNKDLNAPDDNKFWMSTEHKGMVFVYIINKTAIGLVSVTTVKEGNWLSVQDGEIVSQRKLELLAGISRIYVCLNYRRNGIGHKLLECVQENFIYGLSIPKLKIGWSQPSTLGGKLASSFNGVHHKSGKTLVPVYIG